MSAARPAARIYVGHVMHMRLIPRRHRFRYRVFSLLIDLDAMPALLARSRVLRHNRWGILAIHDRDHGARDGSPLRPWVDAALAGAGMPPAARVEMLSFPRMWGYAFNPLTVYYCYGAAGGLAALVYEVKNTFGEQIAYVQPAGPGRGGMFRQRQEKAMYVSPFIAMEQTYRFDVRVPEARLSLRIRQAGAEGETLISAQTGKARAFSDRALLGVLAGHPLMSFKVIAAIHWQALRLVLKGVRPAPASGEAAARGSG
jgi:DUF1365 family protein